ncbi:ATP-grasp domain-containing protein [Polymorphospora sp. NPDC051019]|uniref:ATP-grasp domain-containing protein n=1 Tax=Polymorphospora sp. NPDC051019 TaxID=3155725 RepID=UPI00342946E9
MHALTEEALKARLSTRRVRVPEHAVIGATDDVEALAGRLPGPTMVKALVPLTDRARRGLVVRAADPGEAATAARAMLGSTVAGHRVDRVLVEELAPDGTEYYLAAGFDYAHGVPVLLFGPGGSGVEGRAAPRRIPFAMADPGGLAALPEPLRPVARALVEEFLDLRAKLVELNPVRVGPAGAIVLDAKAALDPDVPAPAGAVEVGVPDEADRRLRELARSLPGGTEVRFGRLDGTVGLISAGGGVLAIVHDALRRHGLRPANFSDVSGGSATTELLGAVAGEVLALRPEGILIVTGITSSISVTGFAEAMVAALAPLRDRPDDERPVIVARMAGPDEADAARIMGALPHCVAVGRDTAVDSAVALLADRIVARRGDGNPA